MTYYTTYNTGGVIERVVYTNFDGTVSKTYTAPTGTPPAYGVAGQQQTVTMPVSLFPSLSFSYYDGSYTGFSTSPLTTPWTRQAQPATRDWSAIAYGNGIFVAVADTKTGTNEVMTSPDGITWTAQGTPPADRQWDGLAFGNGLFVAVSREGTRNNCVMYSTDGVTWKTGASNLNGIPAASQWRSVTYGNGLFVAVSAKDLAGSYPTYGVMTSPDGKNWTGRATSGALAKSWQNITYGGGKFVAVATDVVTNNIMTSSDGISWSIQSAPSAHSWYGVTYGNGTYVAVAHDSSTNDVVTSPDGTTWTARAGASTALWESVAYGNGEFVAVADNGSASNDIMISTNGISWATMTSPSVSGTGYNWHSVTIGGGLFVAVGGGAGSGAVSDSYIMKASASNIASGVYTGTSLATPVNVNSIKFVQMNLTALKQDVAGSNATFTVTEGAAVRTLKTNLGN
jgi:hypothetical protein